MSQVSYPLCKSYSELPPDPQKQGLQRQLGRELELLELPPRRPDRLGRVLGACEARPRRVRLQLRQPVEVDRRRVRADAYCDEVAVPGAELLELRE